MERVTGIGGFFFSARDPQALSLWYRDMLGVDPVPMAGGQEPWVQQAGTTAFAPMPAGSESLGGRAWGINFRVSDLDAMVAQLVAAGVAVSRDPEDYDFGSFATLVDPEGNSIQLWQERGGE